MNADPRSFPLTKSNLQHTYPTGASEGDDPTKRAAPDSLLLNRSEWYEVLYFCNNYAIQYGQGRADVAHKVERLLHSKVPHDLHGLSKITDWLRRNWDMFPNV